MPKVSILMTSYNHEKYIKESIDSVLGQTFEDFELIIVDDCSTDMSFELIKSYKDKRITAIRNKKNQGPEYAFEILHKRARGELIAIADSDNVWEKDKLQKQVEFLEKNPKYAAVFTRVNIIDEFGYPYAEEKATYYYEVFNAKNRSRQEWLRHFFFNGNCLCHPSVLIRKGIYQECGMIVNGLWQIPDLYKWIRLCLKHDIYILDEKLLNFRVHQNNISGGNNIGNILRGSNELYHIYQLFYDINSQDFPLVFKEAPKFIIDKKINVKFALSKLLLERDIPAAQTLGLNKLFEMLNCHKERQEILKLYNYNDVSFKNDETKISPYVLPNWANGAPIYNARLYLDFGGGFNERDVINNSFIADANGDFRVEFNNIAILRKRKKLRDIRFDPCESCAKVKIQDAISSGEKLDVKINKSIFSEKEYAKHDEYDVFYVNDPSYIINKFKKNINNLSISGKISILKPDEVAKLKDLEANQMGDNVDHKSSRTILTYARRAKSIPRIIRDRLKHHNR